MKRRAVIKGAAWSVPVIAAAVAAPHAAASQEATCSDGGNIVYTITGNVVTVAYRVAPDIYELNAHGQGWSFSAGTNFGTAPARGSLSWTVELPAAPEWVQIHGSNSHYGESTCPKGAQ